MTHPGKEALEAIVEALEGGSKVDFLPDVDLNSLDRSLPSPPKHRYETMRCPASTMRAIAAYVAELELKAGILRLCVNCGKTRDASEGRSTPGANCPSPDACTWDMTADEAWQYWRAKAHRLRAIAGKAVSESARAGGR